LKTIKVKYEHREMIFMYLIKHKVLHKIVVIVLLTNTTFTLMGCERSSNEISNTGIDPINTNYLSYSDTAPRNNPLIPAIVERLSPAVVGVATRSIVDDGMRDGAEIEEGIGSGFIIDEEGYVLTNHHVIAGADTVKVIFSNNTEANARIVNYDESQDLAVVKITDNVKIPAVAQLGDSDTLNVGETVIAIGNPLGKEFIGTVTSGIVSAVNRGIMIDNRRLSFIQTDAAINPGNSGGPLIDTTGHVIGINTAKIGASGIEGIGFSIPINIVKGRLTALSTPLPHLGMVAMKVTEDMKKYEAVPTGVFVNGVEKDGCSCVAGLRCGDVIVEFDGQKVTDVKEIDAIKANHKKGDKIEVVFYRNGYRQVRTMTLTH
jgi:serine protease Do